MAFRPFTDIVYISISAALWVILGIALIYTPDLLRWDLIINMVFGVHILLQLSHAATVGKDEWITATVTATSTAAHMLEYLSKSRTFGYRILSLGLNFVATAMAIVQIVVSATNKRAYDPTIHIVSSSLAIVVCFNAYKNFPWRQGKIVASRALLPKKNPYLVFR